MSNDPVGLLVNCLESLEGIHSVQSQYSTEYKALVQIQFDLNGYAIRAQFLASEARLYAEIDLDSLSSAFRNRILSEWKLNGAHFLSYFAPFEVTLWQEEQVYSTLPALKRLIESQGLKLELSTHPLTVEDPERVLGSVQALYERLRFGLSRVLSAYDLSEIQPGDYEGQSIEVLSKRFERSPQNREACLAYHGYLCSVCQFSFEAKYGELGKHFIHVHHIVPLALSGPVLIDPIVDLVPVCPNCHAMLHRRSPPLSPEELKSLLTVRKGIKHEARL